MAEDPAALRIAGTNARLLAFVVLGPDNLDELHLPRKCFSASIQTAFTGPEIRQTTNDRTMGTPDRVYDDRNQRYLMNLNFRNGQWTLHGDWLKLVGSNGFNSGTKIAVWWNQVAAGG